MSSGSLIVLKGIRRNNLYYLKGSAVTRNLVASELLKDDSLRQVGLSLLEAFAK